MKKALSFFIVILLVILGVCYVISARDRQGGVTVIKLCHSQNAEHPVHKTMEYMAGLAKEKSGGRLIIQIFPSEQLGTEKQCIEALQLGYMGMTKISSAAMESFVPKMRVFDMPYLFRDSEHFWKAATGPAGRELLEAGSSKGLRGLCYYDAGARSFYAKKEIGSPKDLSGLKVRVMKSVMLMEMVKAMGGSPVPMAWGELYTSLEQGVVDAAENNPPSFETSRHYEVCKYYTLDEHVRVPDVLVISNRVWNNMTPELQRILQEAVDESVEYNRKLWKESEEASLAKLEAGGVKIIRPDKKPFKEAVRPMWNQYRDSELGGLIEEIERIQ